MLGAVLCRERVTMIAGMDKRIYVNGNKRVDVWDDEVCQDKKMLSFFVLCMALNGTM